jgi:hypothetical protein
VARTWISYRCVPCHPWCTHRTSLVVKKNSFSFPVAVNNSIKVGPLVLLLYMFLITEYIMKLPVLRKASMELWSHNNVDGRGTTLSYCDHILLIFLPWS